MKGNLQYKGNVIIQTFRNIKFPPIEILKDMLGKDFVAYSYIPNYNTIKEKLYFYDQRKDVVELAKLYFSITCSTPDRKSIYSKIKILNKEFEKLIKKTSLYRN